MTLRTIIPLFFLVALFCIPALAQDMVSSTRVSQRASVIQRIGTTDVTVVYHSPLVQERKIFGEVVPFDFVVDGKEYPWRAGSNKNTTIDFTHDVRIEGKALAAGTYGLHILVSKNEWVFIFSKNFDSWGSFQYDKKDDALRVAVQIKKAPFQEWLSYNFINRQAESAKLELHWEKTKASFEIEVDVTGNIIADLSKKEDKTSDDYLTLAQRTLKKNPADTESALEWVQQSIDLEESFQNKIFKADLLIQTGKTAEGEALKKEALAMAKGFNMYYYGLSHYLLQGNKAEAYRILKENVEQNPEDWIAHLALGEYYIKEGKQQMVVNHFEKAYQFAPDNWKNYARYLYLSNKIILKG